MKIKASQPVQVTTKVNFPVGNRLVIQTDKIRLKINETDDSLEINMDKPYKVKKTDRNKRLVIYPEVIKKKDYNNLTEDLLPDIQEYVNWSAIGRLLVGNTSTIRKGYIPKKQEGRIRELLKLVNEWVLKQQEELS